VANRLRSPPGSASERPPGHGPGRRGDRHQSPWRFRRGPLFNSLNRSQSAGARPSPVTSPGSGNTIDFSNASVDLRANFDTGVNQANRDAGDADLLLNGAVLNGAGASAAVTIVGGNGDAGTTNTHPAARSK